MLQNCDNTRLSLRTYLHSRTRLFIEMLRLKYLPCCPRNHCSENQMNRIIISYKSLIQKSLQFFNGSFDLLVTIIDLLCFQNHS